LVLKSFHVQEILALTEGEAPLALLAIDGHSVPGNRRWRARCKTHVLV